MPDAGWLHDVNLAPDRRGPAGLGARVVRDNDDEFLAAAWDQAGDVRALREELNRARLAAEVGRSHARRLATLDDAGLLQVTARLHLFVRQAGATLTQRIGGSAVFPAGLVSAALLRQTRPGSVLARRAAAERPGPTPARLRVTDRFLAGSAPADERSDALGAVRPLRRQLPAPRRRDDGHGVQRAAVRGRSSWIAPRRREVAPDRVARRARRRRRRSGGRTPPWP